MTEWWHGVRTVGLHLTLPAVDNCYISQIVILPYQGLCCVKQCAGTVSTDTY